MLTKVADQDQSIEKIYEIFLCLSFAISPFFLRAFRENDNSVENQGRWRGHGISPNLSGPGWTKPNVGSTKFMAMGSHNSESWLVVAVDGYCWGCLGVWGGVRLSGVLVGQFYLSLVCKTNHKRPIVIFAGNPRPIMF